MINILILSALLGALFACFVEVFLLGLYSMIKQILEYKPIWGIECPFCEMLI